MIIMKSMSTKRPYERFEQFLDNTVAATDYEGHTDFFTYDEICEGYNNLVYEVSDLKRDNEDLKKMLHHFFTIITRLQQRNNNSVRKLSPDTYLWGEFFA